MADNIDVNDILVHPYVPVNFPNITVSSINCNSLNMSSATKHVRIRKFYGIVSLNTDIIFVSDIRMCNKAGQTDLPFIRDTFETNPYCSYNFYQSVSNKRGVGILVKKTLNFVCLDTERDQTTDNYLLIRARVNGVTVILGSIYGPNVRDDDFFDRLLNGLNRFPGDPVILGGDFNCTVSCLPVRENPDNLNMAELPNTAHSRKISEICTRRNLTDPYRALYPERTDFSYAQWGNLRNNRSRIDYFLVSTNIVEHVSDCYIKNSTQSRLFDHKAIFLSFEKSRTTTSRPSISKHILRDPDLEIIVNLATLECYVQTTINQAVKNRLLNLIGRGYCSARDWDGKDYLRIIPRVVW
jgi:exonuclease III